MPPPFCWSWLVRTGRCRTIRRITSRPNSQPATAAELVAILDALLAQVDELVSGLSDDDLDRELPVPFEQQQAGDAFSAALTYALTHVGGIAGIRAMGGFPVPAGY